MIAKCFLTTIILGSLASCTPLALRTNQEPLFGVPYTAEKGNVVSYFAAKGLAFQKLPEDTNLHYPSCIEGADPYYFHVDTNFYYGDSITVGGYRWDYAYLEFAPDQKLRGSGGYVLDSELTIFHALRDHFTSLYSSPDKTVKLFEGGTSLIWLFSAEPIGTREKPKWDRSLISLAHRSDGATYFNEDRHDTSYVYLEEDDEQ